MTDKSTPLKQLLLDIRASNALNRCGIVTLGDLMARIERYGLWVSGDGTFLFDGDPVVLRRTGPKAWVSYLALLDSVGFDWRKHVSPNSHWTGYETDFKEKLFELLERLRNCSVTRNLDADKRRRMRKNLNPASVFICVQ